MALFEAEPIQDLGETNEALKSRLGRLIAEAASKHDPGLQSLIDEAIKVLEAVSKLAVRRAAHRAEPWPPSSRAYRSPR